MKMPCKFNHTDINIAIPASWDPIGGYLVCPNKKCNAGIGKQVPCSLCSKNKIRTNMDGDWVQTCPRCKGLIEKNPELIDFIKDFVQNVRDEFQKEMSDLKADLKGSAWRSS